MEEPVIVIHGTFDNDATWWRPDGSFCERLDNRLRQQGSRARCWDSMAAADAIREFRWNGLNSEASRTHAAELLATKIAALIEKQSVERVHFVAHSHGGNVLLKALFLSRVNVYDDKLGSVIFLGTPFFSYKSMTSNWRFIGKFSKIRDGEYYRKNFFVIASKYDEAYRLLRHAVQFRDSARFYSRKWSENSRSGEPLARSLRPSTMLGLLYGRYRLVKIGPNFEFALKLGQRINQIGYIGRLRLALNMLAVHGIQSLVSVIAPVVSITKRWGQRWGTYFGIRAMASTALGDDLGFERILSVNQNSDMIPTVMVKLNDEIENAMLLRASVGSDVVVKQFYLSIGKDAVGDEAGATIVDSVVRAFESKQLVHSQYYNDEAIIDIVAKAIVEEPRLSHPIMERG